MRRDWLRFVRRKQNASKVALDDRNRIVDRASPLTDAIACFRDFETNDTPGVIRAIIGSRVSKSEQSIDRPAGAPHRCVRERQCLSPWGLIVFSLCHRAGSIDLSNRMRPFVVESIRSSEPRWASKGQRKNRVPFEIVAPSWARSLLVKRRPVQADWSSTKLMITVYQTAHVPNFARSSKVFSPVHSASGDPFGANFARGGS